MSIKGTSVIGRYKLDDGNEYLFCADGTIYKKDIQGTLIKIEKNEKNIQKIKEDIGEGETDIID